MLVPFYGKLYVFYHMAPSHDSITWLNHGNRIIGMTSYLNDCVAIHSKTKSRGWMIRYCKKRQAGRAFALPAVRWEELLAQKAKSDGRFYYVILLCDDIM